MRKVTDNQQTFLILLSNTFYMYFPPLKGREKHKKSARFHNILSLKAILAWSLNYLTKQQKIEIFWSNEKETILTERKTMLQQLFKVM